MLVAGPFWGVIADKFHCHRLILIINCIGIILTMGCQPLLTIKYGNPQTNKCPEPSNQFTRNFNQTNNSTFNARPSSQENGQYGTLFLIFFFTQILAAFFEGSSMAFIDVATIRKSQLSKHRKIDYGRQRLWGPIGAIFGVNMTNLFIKYFPKANITCYSGLFLNYITCHILMTISALVLYKGLSFKDETNQQQSLEEKEQSKKSFRRIFRKNLIQFEVLFVYLLSVVGGSLTGVYQYFLFLHLKEIGTSQTVMTLSISIAAAAGIFGYFFSAKIIRFFGGPLKSIIIALSVFAVRFIGYALSPNGWILLIFQPMHILSYALFLTSGIQYMKETSPLMVITSMVSLFQTMFEGVGI